MTRHPNGEVIHKDADQTSSMPTNAMVATIPVDAKARMKGRTPTSSKL